MGEWVSFSSTNIAAALYEGGTLFVRFVSGSVYQYDDVPLSVWTGLLTAGSKGKYHHRHIRNSYSYRRVA
jgi:KTSC domain